MLSGGGVQGRRKERAWRDRKIKECLVVREEVITPSFSEGMRERAKT